MSKKMNKLVLLSALMIAIIGTFGTVSAEEQTHDLIAGGGNGEGLDVGNVIVTYTDTHIVVEFTTTDGWCMTETHLHIANDSEYLPQTKKGNPRPGQFDYSEEHDNVTEYKYEVPLSEIEISADGTVCIAAHAVVHDEGNPIVDGEGNLTYIEESAWGNEEPFNPLKGGNWAMYSIYTLPIE